jgi:hypothetical protein
MFDIRAGIETLRYMLKPADGRSCSGRRRKG